MFKRLLVLPFVVSVFVLVASSIVGCTDNSGNGNYHPKVDDAGVDTGVDSATDAGADTATDTGSDAAADGGADGLADLDATSGG